MFYVTIRRPVYCSITSADIGSEHSQIAAFFQKPDAFDFMYEAIAEDPKCFEDDLCIFVCKNGHVQSDDRDPPTPLLGEPSQQPPVNDDYIPF